MATDLVDRLRGQLGGPRDGALLRYSLGNALLANGDAEAAAQALREALGFDPEYSAAWKMLGKALEQSGDRGAAMTAFRDGIAIAQARGDKQAEKEMRVFLRRLERTDQPSSGRPDRVG
ncbi:MAG TPA: tetratricopeptide repeat protein [Rhodanobacteraceae bacterium]|nr:tetratricopeptide repeat protein [Rhodanobacteraceae bacterium]